MKRFIIVRQRDNELFIARDNNGKTIYCEDLEEAKDIAKLRNGYVVDLLFNVDTTIELNNKLAVLTNKLNELTA